jgi:uncharacterized coiled-coil protein SlyX
MDHRIAEAEMRSTAQTSVLTALIKAGYDTTETEQQLWAHMDSLAALRRQRCALRGGLEDAET